MSDNFRYPVFLLLVFVTATALHAAQLKTLSLDFTRELTEQEKTEHTVGTLHYSLKTAQVVIEVSEPVKQIMVAKDNILEIYYPVEQQALRFISEVPVPLPLVESIIQATQAIYGLTALMGYTLDRHEVVDGTIYTYWDPPEKQKDELGIIKLGERDDKFMSAEVKNPEGQLIARTLYRNHRKIGINYIPMQVTFRAYGVNSEALRYEKIFYCNPQANADPPNPMLSFTIPESVKVKEIKW